MDDLLILFSLQLGCIKTNTFQNEFETMRFFFDRMPEKKKRYIQDLSVQWLQNLEQNENLEFNLQDASEKIQKSKCLRQQGNLLFTAKGDGRNILGACRLYNDAIYTALDTKGEELAFAFANRATALQTFGYYEQAYDDCVCALRLGYPELLRHKIIIRQAYCSMKMQNFDRAEKHLNELRELTLSPGFSKELKELLRTFDELKHERISNTDKEIHLNRETQEIITTKNGRHMQAKCQIEKNQLVFTERASAFVSVGDTRRMCEQCGRVNFIPIPCLDCRGRVNYCSLKCQEEHIEIHVYECPAYRIQLFAHVGNAHLALRIVLDNGLLSALDELKLDSKISTSEVWRSLTEDGDVWKNNGMPYVESLRMITHLNKMAQIEIEMFALMSHHLVVYLKQYTTFFEVLNARNANIDWELLMGSLIMRHSGQLTSNGHASVAVIPQPLTLMTTTDFHMLNENIWSSPWHIKLGYLHFFSYYNTVGALNLPYLSLCNHSCVPSIGIQFSGRFISTYALRNLKKGEEITNCYDLDYRNRKRETRRKTLQEIYYFECQCENCLQPDSEDEVFNKFYQYRCDNIKCGQIFIPKTPEILPFNLWEDDDSNAGNLFCTICGHKQTFKWYHEVKHLLSRITEASARRRLYTIFKESEQYLVGLNEARCVLARKFVFELFRMQWINVHINDQDYCHLIAMIKYVLSVTRKQSSVNSISYVTQMLYLWDLMAKRKYKCSKADMEEMLWAVNIISDDSKLIFLNYYNDYIKE